MHSNFFAPPFNFSHAPYNHTSSIRFKLVAKRILNAHNAIRDKIAGKPSAIDRPLPCKRRYRSNNYNIHNGNLSHLSSFLPTRRNFKPLEVETLSLCSELKLYQVAVGRVVQRE